MKKAAVIFILMRSVYCSIGQEIHPETPRQSLTKEEYTRKWKSNRTGGVVLLAAGAVMTTAGMLIAVNNFDISFNWFATNTTSSNNDGTIETVLVLGGMSAMLTSIVPFVLARKYKRKAFSFTFKNERLTYHGNCPLLYKTVPSLAIQIQL